LSCFWSTQIILSHQWSWNNLKNNWSILNLTFFPKTNKDSLYIRSQYIFLKTLL
jgi:hypothetical protein